MDVHLFLALALVCFESKMGSGAVNAWCRKVKEICNKLKVS